MPRLVRFLQLSEPLPHQANPPSPHLKESSILSDSFQCTLTVSAGPFLPSLGVGIVHTYFPDWKIFMSKIWEWGCHSVHWALVLHDQSSVFQASLEYLKFYLLKNK